VSPISNQPSASEINVELSRASNAAFSMDGADERALAQVPTGQINFSDFIGKSAQTPYERYLQYLTNVVGATGQIIGSNQLQAAPQNAWTFCNTVLEQGSMYGSPFSGAGWTTVDSLWNRIIQHMCESYAEFTAIASNNWQCAVLRGGVQFVPGLVGVTRNNYTSIDYPAGFNSCNNNQLYWWDGTNAWYRANGAARQPVAI